MCFGSFCSTGQTLDEPPAGLLPCATSLLHYRFYYIHLYMYIYMYMYIHIYRIYICQHTVALVARRGTRMREASQHLMAEEFAAEGFRV